MRSAMSAARWWLQRPAITSTGPDRQAVAGLESGPRGLRAQTALGTSEHPHGLPLSPQTSCTPRRLRNRAGRVSGTGYAVPIRSADGLANPYSQAEIIDGGRRIIINSLGAYMLKTVACAR